jgi:hypothetical protein
VSSPVTPSVGAGYAGGSSPAPMVTMAQPPSPWQPGQSRPLGDDAVKHWQARVERGAAKDKQFHPQAQRALNRYAKALMPAPGVDDFDPLLDYAHVEGRKAQLYHRTPEINLLPVDPQDQSVPYQQILPLREKVLNHELGPEKTNAKRALHKTLIDALAASGDLILMVGFEASKLPVPPDPITGAQPMDSMGQPVTEVVVWSRRFIEAVSSRRLVKPADFRDTDFDKAPWLAVRGCMPVPMATRLGWTLPADFQGTAPDKEMYFDDGTGTEYDASDPQVEYTMIWYKAYLYDPAVFNPDLYRCLILVKGSDVPAWHTDSPFQSLTPEGQLTDDSMVGNPIHVDTLRDLIDTAHVPSDLVIGERLSTELTKFRTGLMRNRRGRRPVTLISDKAGQPLIDKVAANAGPIPAPDEYFDGAGNQRLLAIVQAGTEPRDNYEAQRIIKSDWDDAMGGSANQRGTFTSGKRTATEARLVQGNSAARARVDEDRVREYVSRLIRKFDAIVQRTMTLPELTKILGQQGAMLYDAWKALPGKYAYKIQPDSGRYVDAEEYRAQKVNEYNLLRKDPLINAPELDRTVVTALGYDAGKLVPADQAPEKPEAPKISISFNAEQAMASPAEAQLMLDILEQSGYQIDPAMRTQLIALATLRAQVAAVAPNPEHGGPASKTERIDKRASERTGGLEGVGKVA